MEDTLLNLNEGSFPISIKKLFSNLDNLDNLGTIKKGIKTDLKIEKFSNNLLLAKGKISVTLESECQRCSELFDVNLQIKSQVGIKDITEENLNSKGP